MKKIATILCAFFALFLFAGCADNDLIISIGNGSVPDDSVSVQLKYSDTWKNGDEIFTVNYGHESAAVLAEEYYIAFFDQDPLLSSSYTANTIYSFKKADLEGRTVSNGRFSGKAGKIVIDDLAAVLPQGDGACTAYIVFYSSETDFDDITTFSSHEISYEWQENGVKLAD